MWEQTRPADDDPRCHRLPSLNHGDLGRGRHEQFCVSPFIFNSKVGTAVCRSCRYVTTNIWEMSGSWLGVGRSCKHPYYKFAHTQPPSDSLSPLSPYQPPRALVPYEYLRPILRISWAYIDHIFALYIEACHIFWTLSTQSQSQQVHSTCTTIPKQHCEVKSIHAYTPLRPLLYNYSSSPTPPLHYASIPIEKLH